jgi:hypothetical protein
LAILLFSGSMVCFSWEYSESDDEYILIDMLPELRIWNNLEWFWSTTQVWIFVRNSPIMDSSESPFRF